MSEVIEVTIGSDVIATVLPESAVDATTVAALAAEVTRATNAEATKASTAALTAETSARQAADSSEASTRAAADTTNADAITAETTRATTAEATKVPTSRQVAGHPLTADVTITKGDVGLGSVDNTPDSGKPVSTAQQSALDLKAPLASPALTGTPTINGSNALSKSAGDSAYDPLGQAATAAARFDLRAYGATPASSSAAQQTALAQAVTDASAAGANAEVYIPAGVWSPALSAGAWMTLTKGIRVRGHHKGWTTLKVPAGTGNFEALITGASGSTDLSDLEVSHLTFDYNTANRPANQAALNLGDRQIINVAHGDRVWVHHCRFINIDAVQTVFLSGAGGLSDAIVEDNYFEVDAGSTFWHDHSSIYTHTANGGKGAVIRNNALRGNSSLGARTAIETHGSDQLVTGNRVYNYAKGGNLTGISDPASKQIIWSDNLFYGVSAGIYLWSDTYHASTTPGLKNVNIHDNTIVVDVDTWNANFGVNGGTGIYLERTGTFATRNVKIHDNTIELLPFAATLAGGNNHSHGISWGRTATVTDVNLQIYNNIIDGAVACGIAIEGTAVTQVGGGIWDNSVLNPGQGSGAGAVFSTAFTAGVFLSSVLQHFRVERNRLRDDQVTHTMTQPIHLGTIQSGSTGVRVVDNRVSYADGTSIAPILSSTTAGVAVFAAYDTAAYVAPSGNFEAGSRIVDRSTGTIHTQTAAPNGTTWADTTFVVSAAPPLFSRKASGTTRTGTATVADDPDLQATVAANTTYLVEGVLAYDSPTTADFRFAFAVPTGASLTRWDALGPVTSASSTSATLDSTSLTSASSQQVWGGIGAGNPIGGRYRAILAVGSTAGTFKLQWAQGTSDAGNTTLEAGSWLMLTKVA